MSECRNCGYTMQVEEFENEITTLKQREAKLVEALKFYADIDNSRVTSCDDIDGEHSPTMSGGLYLTGKKARETLKELGVEI